ncbi:MAG TPA: dual specificity protein phosphatase family protein [Planctomycetaceae bacterium]|nr:dual specificity protein phosphatase family protein [Planctomycetaceae bacterium]
MRRIGDSSLFIGHVGDLRDVRSLHAAGIAAVVDLAANEAPAALTRDLIYCRLPLVDGAGNPEWLLRAAVMLLATFVRDDVPCLVCCSAGMSRSPAVAAAALARARSMPAKEALEQVAAVGAIDVSPGLWQEVEDVIE